jgi:hypothetical protein
MFNISRAKSGKLKSEKAKKSPVCWANKGSRAILAYYKKNWNKFSHFVVNLVMYVKGV